MLVSFNVGRGLIFMSEEQKVLSVFHVFNNEDGDLLPFPLAQSRAVHEGHELSELALRKVVLDAVRGGMVLSTLDFQHKTAMNRFKDISGGTVREVLEVHCLAFRIRPDNIRTCWYCKSIRRGFPTSFSKWYAPWIPLRRNNPISKLMRTTRPCVRRETYSGFMTPTGYGTQSLHQK